MSVIKNTCLLPINNYKWQQKQRESSQQKQIQYSSLGKVQKTDRYMNNYCKKFNLRKINRTQQSIKKKILLIQDTKQQQQQCKNICNKINKQLYGCKNNKINNIRVHTEKIRNKNTDIVKDGFIGKKNYCGIPTLGKQQQNRQRKFNHLTPFQRAEIGEYQAVYYVGKRRIYSVRDFTDKNGDPKVAANDGIIYRYEVLDIIGKGSFGQVFRVFDHKKRQFSALKIIRNQPKFTIQAKIQIQILQHVLFHDKKMKNNIIQLKDSFFYRGHACLVFQLLYQNLYQFIKQQKFCGLELDVILKITIQILQCLLFFKKYHIIHCDLKPENILLKCKNKTGIKIIDVGSGCYQAEQKYTYIQSRYYRAPEIIFGIHYTCAIDIWSLGCIIVQLYQGLPLFPGQDQHEQIGMFMELLGYPPNELLQKGNRSNKFFKNYKQRTIPNRKGIHRKPGSKTFKDVLRQCQNQQFIDFVNRCLVWEPQKRITPSEALFHPWIMQGIPSEIRKQHIYQVQKNSQL